jgi:hypothetical protein
MAKKVKKVKRCVEMFTDEVSIVTRGANGHKKFLMVKSETGDVGQISVDDVDDGVPGKDSTLHERTTALTERSKKYGIEVTAKAADLHFPADAPMTERLYGDPVNLKYPLANEGDTEPDPARTRDAIAEFKANYKSYGQESSQSRVYERIVRAALSAQIDITLDDNDPAGNLLPGDLQKRLPKDADGTDTAPAGTEPNTVDNDTDEQGVGDWLDGVEKSLDEPGDTNWLDGVESALDSVGGNQGPEGVQKEAPVETPEPINGTATATPAEPVADAKLTKALAELKKLGGAKDAKIEEMSKNIVSLQAELSRLQNNIGSANTLRPGESGGSDATPDPLDDRNSSIDLGPPLE